MTTVDPLTVNQLLGRLAYFHVLFIEPALTRARSRNPPTTPCCLHNHPAPAVRSAPGDVTTPWSVLAQIAEDLGATGCRTDSRKCCPACRVHACARTIAYTWITIEVHSYGCRYPHPEQAADWSLTIAETISAVFTDQHRPACARARTITCGPRPPVDRFPLSGELAQLWHAPAEGSPVISWLNHCAALEDIARHLRRRSMA